MTFKIPASVRKKIIEKLLTSPERRALYETTKDIIEEVVTHPSVRRAYIGGSFASKKLAPKDIDLIIRHGADISSKEGEDFYRRFWPFIADPIVGGASEESKLHLMEAWPKDVKMAESLRRRFEQAIGEATDTSFDTSLAGMKREMAYAREKYGPDYKWIRIASLLGTLGGSMAALTDLLEPSEAEASPVGTLLKGGTKAAAKALGKAVKGPASRTAKDLIGKKLPALGDRVIKNVTKGRGDWRYIIFDDESVVPVTKDVLADLERAMGTAAKQTEFAQKQAFEHVAGAASPLEQARKSLAYHRSRQLPATVASLEDYYKTYKQNLRSVGQEPPELAVVREPGTRNPFTMPLFYAEILEKEGDIKIIKRLK
jgi:hypothetical protein